MIFPSVLDLGLAVHALLTNSLATVESLNINGWTVFHTP